MTYTFHVVVEREAPPTAPPSKAMKPQPEVKRGDQAMAVIGNMAKLRCNDFVFPGRGRGGHIERQAVNRICPEGSSPHGFRASFSEWSNETTSFSHEIIEASLPHAVSDAVARAYWRGDGFDKRRLLMKAWANYCDGVTSDNVIQLRA